jgi:hypothetical protein
MRISVFLILFTFCGILKCNEGLFAQDSTRFVVYDVVYLKDGRVLKGQILAYDSYSGGLSFRDTEGRVYNFGRDDYEYFEEKRSYPIKTKKGKSIHERKRDGIRYNVGVNPSVISLREIKSDDLSNSYPFNDLALGLTAQIGKYFVSSHYVGLSSEYFALSSRGGYFNIGVKYAFEYDNKSSNWIKYVPLELKFQKMNLQHSSREYLDPGDQWNSPTIRYDYPISKFNSALISIGHGFGYVLKSGNSVNFELTYQRHFVLSQEYVKINPLTPMEDYKYQIHRVTLGISFSF